MLAVDILNFSKSIFKRKSILVLGDSHASVFDLLRMHLSILSYQVFVKSVGGATASGLENPNSKTRSLTIFNKAFSDKQPDIVILQLGEVDTGFVIWFRAEKYNVPVPDMMDKAIINYQKLIEEYNQKAKVVVVSAPLPTIKDGQSWGEIANARKDIVTSQVERTDLTVEFNLAIQKYCLKQNISYINLDAECRNEQGLIKEEYLNSDPNDHHYEQKKYCNLLSNHLNKELE
jgi:hypothetical protein